MIATREDAKLLQEDLATLEEWERQWKMRFHPDKCTKLTVTSKRNPVKSEYKLHDHIKASVSSAKYLKRDTYILSTAIAYLCVIDAKHFLNDPHSDKNAIMSVVLIPQCKAIYKL